MTNPINNTNRSTAESLSAKSSTARGQASSSGNTAAAPDTAPTSSTADTVSLSAESTQVRELQNRLADIPEVNAQKVAQIKQEIANGNYPLDSKAIAANLLNFEKALSE